ncbi:MAG: SDR family NAD(P)-dependent oxidoreductase [Methanobacterium formicicum]|jgi:NAD(P)-dependent dehydrogenase (short-subunit alcohol dehydrogenase family)|uniref:Oxidoreductase MW2403 n=1 Tax=Methanobacterium formicicum TaxID=2162 RepID=A0A089ZVF4_METFO|nr:MULTISPECIES: SDR family oxidoreductase [Methanobacterium]AIS32339.1 short-chain dehydrogenase family protein [Methanobacterium formicicum]MBF4473898.1 SDR family oxidoreductase [Methanobacterium formicicum]MDD4810895.1 SDR family NAD(P)-dependent oxidoreductase [Methanobacterium formicicum]MDG3546244.1 SDR family NAD(P)-dependent oxidoreductase [Methanobacterium formicicum]CEL24417.1 oxidoreductase MW2403 [Methanobacterium formicicum]
MSNPEYYKDKICIVTGANSGIGYAVSEELLKRGAIVYMAGRNPDKVSKAAQKLSKFKDRVHTIIVDVTVQEQVENAINNTVAETGRLDLLFNNAGVGGTLQFETATMEDWKNIIDVNLWSVIYGVHTAVPIMLKQGSGHIINTSSIAGLLPPPFQALYSLTKFGVTGMTECLRYEYAEKGLHFSTICPANIATPIFQKSIDGTTHDEIKIPDDAYPVDKAAQIILDRVSEYKGIIVVPEEPYTKQWKLYCQQNEEVEEVMLQMARDRREAYEKGGNYY